jgi:hypothetical protein
MTELWEEWLRTTGTGFSITKGLSALIEMLSSGYSMVLKHIWIVVLPVGLDLYLWLGPRLSIQPLTRFLLRLWLSLEQGPADMQPLLAFNRELLETMGREVNLFSFLSSSLLGMPSVLAGGRPGSVVGSSVTWGEGWSALAILALIPLLVVGGLFLGSLYLGIMGQFARDGSVDLRLLLQRVWRYWGLITLFGMLLIGVLSLLGFPLMMVAGLLELASPALARFALLGAVGLVLWMLFHLFFVPHAIVVSDSGLLRAVWSSLVIVARNFWSALTLVILMNLISAGFGVIWDRISVNALLTLVSIAGNAFIGTGLMAASLIFYRDRFAQWQAWMEQVRSASRKDE